MTPCDTCERCRGRGGRVRAPGALSPAPTAP